MLNKSLETGSRTSESFTINEFGEIVRDVKKISSKKELDSESIKQIENEKTL